MRILPHTQLVWAQAAQAHDTRSFHTFLIYLFIYLFIFFLLLCERSAKRDIYGRHAYYITTEFEYAKSDSRLTAYGGVVLLQRFEFIQVCIGTQRFWFVFFVVCQLLGPI